MSDDVVVQLPAPEAEQEHPQVVALRLQITELQEQLARSNRNSVLLEGQFQTIADALLEEAQSRDWCDEYDRFCERVNRSLGRNVLTPCERRWTITYSVTMTVVANNADAARSGAESALRCVTDDESVEDIDYRYEEMERC